MTYSSDNLGTRAVATKGGGAVAPLSEDEATALLAEWNAAAAARAERAAAVNALAYRYQRAVAYRDEMGAEAGDFIKTIGDVLDVVLGWAQQEIDAGRAQATDAMTAILMKRAQIKARYPKPGD